ncbi:MAG: site-specific integrase [Gammaproteobacteria bacterium]
MFEHLIKMQYVNRRLQKLSKHKDLLDKCADYLIFNHYANGNVGHYRRAIEHFLFWFESQGCASGINESYVKKFITHHIPACKCDTPAPRRIEDLRPALRLMMRIINQDHPESISKKNISEIDKMIAEFNKYLIDVCGLSSNTRVYHCRHVRKFLSILFKKSQPKIEKLNPTNVRNFLYSNIQDYKRRSFGVFVYSLRTFFKFLKFKSVGNPNLIASLPKILEWKAAALPEYLNKEDLNKFLNVFDRNTELGKRDYAMVICMIELGLRGHEVANLKLEDIDWRNQTLYIPRGKTRQSYVLPMTQLLIKSLIDYLSYGRPKTSSREIFVYHRAPVGKGIIPKVVTEVARRAFVRAGLNPKISGAHVLRRTFATNLLQNGVTIKEIADLLRHRSIDITSIYTKVDFSNLAQVALPWPEEVL